MRALALSSETAKYMFWSAVCQCAFRTSCMNTSRDLEPLVYFLCPRAVISHNPSGHQRQVEQLVFVKPARQRQQTDFRLD